MSTLIVIGSFNYPQGSAPTNRIHLYCKAMKEIRNKAFVISLSAPYTKTQPFPPIGHYEGIPYFYTSRSYIRENSFLKRNWKRLLGIINAWFLIRKIALKHSNCALLFYGTTFYQELIFKSLSLFYNIPTIADAAEAPRFLKEKKRFPKIHEFFYIRVRLLLYNSLIVISNYLRDYYSTVCPNKPTIQIPILVDFERFTSLQQGNTNDKIVTYVGDMKGNKDGVLDLLEAFSIVQKKQSDVKLKLIGPAPNKDMDRIKSKIATLRLKNNVILTGHIDVTEIPYQLITSTTLALARPNHIQAQAGFPTKLGEYLASKRPVVITNTGEVPNYLKDGYSAYIAEPGNISNIADKILEALDDDKAELTGKRGHDIALENFSYKNHAKSLNNLILDIQNK